MPIGVISGFLTLHINSGIHLEVVRRDQLLLIILSPLMVAPPRVYPSVPFVKHPYVTLVHQPLNLILSPRYCFIRCCVTSVVGTVSTDVLVTLQCM